MENTATSPNIQDALKEKDSNALNYKIEDIGESIFKKAENEEEIIFLMGNNVIQKIYKEKIWNWYEAYKTEKTLKALNTRLMIPIIAAMVETVLNERKKEKK